MLFIVKKAVTLNTSENYISLDYNNGNSFL